MEHLWTDLRVALRRLGKSPGFTVAAVLTLALGIGAATAIFTVGHGVLMQPLPFPEPDRIVAIEAIDLEAPSRRSAFSVPDFADYRQNNRVFESMAAFRGAYVTLIETAGEPEQLWGLGVTADFFPVMGVEPLLGRVIQAVDDRPGNEKVVVLGHDLWQRRFGADSGVLGRTVQLGAERHTVIGVMPPGFGTDDFGAPGFETAAALFVPLALDFAEARRSRYLLFSRARLLPGVTPEQAQADLRTIAARLARDHPEHIRSSSSVRVRKLHRWLVGDVRMALWAFHAAVGLLLLIAGANVANLLLARSVRQQRELALRAALGAGRGRLTSMLLTESLLLAVAGGALGVLVAGWGVRLLLAAEVVELPRSGAVGVNTAVLLSAFALTLAVGLAVGVLPLRRLRRLDLVDALKKGGRRAGAGRRRFDSGLVVAEVALALVLSIGAGLLVHSLARLLDVDPGFSSRNALTAQIDLPRGRYSGDTAQIDFFRRLLERVSRLPEVEAVGGVYPMPLAGGGLGRFFGIGGRPIPEPGDILQSSARAVTPGYFRTLGVPLVRGRTLTAEDHLDAARVVVINRSAARRFWPDEDPIGQRITFDNLHADDPITWWTVVGVVGDVYQKSLAAGAEPVIYHAFDQLPMSRMTLVLRTAGPPNAVLAPLRHELTALDPNLPLTSVQTLAAILDRSVARPRFDTALLSLFAVLALTLAAVGVYGLSSYSVDRRRREIGIRLALGARPRALLGDALRRALTPVLLGVVLGLGVALAATRVLSSLLFEIVATDPATFLAATAVLTTVGAVASWFPALRATRVDPVAVLQAD